MEMKLLNLKTIYLSLILYAPSIFQITTGIGLSISGFFIGLFPSVIIYFVWLLLLTMEIDVKDKKRNRIHVGVLLLTLFIVIPYYWFLLSKIVNEVNYFYSIQPIIMIIVMWLLFALVSSWSYISKKIYLKNRQMSSSYNSAIGIKDYFKYFLFFLGGPITIWWLQPIIIQVIDCQEK
jgi:hypothetical protein